MEGRATAKHPMTPHLSISTGWTPLVSRLNRWPDKLHFSGQNKNNAPLFSNNSFLKTQKQNIETKSASTTFMGTTDSTNNGRQKEN